MTSLLPQNDVIWRKYVKMTSFWRYNDVIITSYVRWDIIGFGLIQTIITDLLSMYM